MNRIIPKLFLTTLFLSYIISCKTEVKETNKNKLNNAEKIKEEIKASADTSTRKESLKKKIIKPSENLVEKQLGKTYFYVSIPDNYYIEEERGNDFYIYFFYPKDTTALINFSAGIYIGDFPKYFEKDNPLCAEEKIVGKLLGQKIYWKIFNCEKTYSVQTICESNTGWNKLIHAFGRGNSQEEKELLIKILSTLKQK